MPESFAITPICSGHIDIRAQAEVPRARRTDTPTYVGELIDSAALASSAVAPTNQRLSVPVLLDAKVRQSVDAAAAGG
jgi:hypothetical protein